MQLLSWTTCCFRWLELFKYFRGLSYICINFSDSRCPADKAVQETKLLNKEQRKSVPAINDDGWQKRPLMAGSLGAYMHVWRAKPWHVVLNLIPNSNIYSEEKKDLVEMISFVFNLFQLKWVKYINLINFMVHIPIYIHIHWQWHEFYLTNWVLDQYEFGASMKFIYSLS